MKKIISGIMITFVLALIFELTGFWQAMVIAGAFGGLITDKSWQAFIIGMSGVMLCWFSILVYGEIFHNIIPLTKLTSQILMIPQNHYYFLFLITILLGGLLGGLGGLNGVWWKQAIKSKQSY